MNLFKDENRKCGEIYKCMKSIEMYDYTLRMLVRPGVKDILFDVALAYNIQGDILLQAFQSQLELCLLVL